MISAHQMEIRVCLVMEVSLFLTLIALTWDDLEMFCNEQIRSPQI